MQNWPPSQINLQAISVYTLSTNAAVTWANVGNCTRHVQWSKVCAVTLMSFLPSSILQEQLPKALPVTVVVVVADIRRILPATKMLGIQSAFFCSVGGTAEGSTVFRAPIMWNLWFREDRSKVGPACIRRRCSERMISLVMGCFPSRITGCDYISTNFFLA